MKKFAALLLTIALTACGEKPPPTIVAVNTLCTSTTRFHATEAQIAVLKANKTVMETMIDWLFAFGKTRDVECAPRDNKN